MSSLSCECGKPSCVITNRKALGDFFLSLDMKMKCSDWDHRCNKYQTEIEVPRLNMNKCHMFKLCIKYNTLVDIYAEQNRENIKLTQIEEKDHVIANGTLMKKHIELKKCKRHNRGLLEKLEKEKQLLRDKIADMKKLRKENKRLRRIIASQVQVAGESDDDEDGKGEEEEKKKTEEEIEEQETYDGEWAPPNFVSDFQRLKDYMNEQNASMTKICWRSGVEKSKYLDAYLYIRYSRLDHCHPVVEKISTDAEYLGVISQYL